MKKMLSILVLLLLLSPVYSGLAQATFYHFEDIGDANVKLNSEGNKTYTWEFKLNTDAQNLWVIPENPLTNKGTAWSIDDSNYYGVGHMSAADDLHQAYLTMKFINVNDGKNDSENEEISFALDLATIVTSWYITEGGLSPDKVPSSLDYDSGGLNVLSYMEIDHSLSVTINALKGDFTVEKMDLAGCYESPPAPVPEPGTLVLLGMGFVLLSVLLRRKVRLAPSKTRR